LARYEQRISKYPLDKTHNYKISRKSLDSRVRELSKIKPDEMSKISVIGASRAETIVAGSCVIDTLLEKYNFSEMYVSNHGLREGALSLFLEDSKMYDDGYLTAEQIRKAIGLDERYDANLEKENLLNDLLYVKLISKRERNIIDYAEKILSEKSSFSNPQSIFYSIMDRDIPLNHNDQLVLGLSLVHTRHTKTSDWLFTRYKTVLFPQDRLSIKKISTLITLRKILERTNSKVEFKSHEPRLMEFIISQSKSIQKFLLRDALRKFEIVFDIKLILSTRPYPGSSQTSILEL
jgi:exopolyphosphatase/guanosine-5'-triphosphate,3'-diphosphate pyrophosphatase